MTFGMLADRPSRRGDNFRLAKELPITTQNAEGMMRMYRGLLGVVALGVQACTSAAMHVDNTPPADTPQQYESERQQFIDVEQRRAARNDPSGAQKSFDFWTGAGIVVGLAGGIYAAVVNTDKHWGATQVKSVGGVGSALSGAITGWVAYNHYERSIPDGEKCKKVVGDVVDAFTAAYPSGATPVDASAWAAFRQYKVDKDKTTSEACPK